MTSARRKPKAARQKQPRKAAPAASSRSERRVLVPTPSGSRARNAPAGAGESIALQLSNSVQPGADGAHWTFLTNHSHVLVVLSRNPSLVLREVAAQVGITERAVQRIIADLEAGGIIQREKVGRRNQYRIRTDQPLRHCNEAHRTIGELLALINRP